MRTNSGLNFSNISAGFAGASNALQQGVSIKAQQALEAMKDARYENIQRLRDIRQQTHDDAVQARDLAVRQAIAAESNATQEKIAERNITLQGNAQRAYFDQLDARAAIAAKAAKAEEDARDARNTQSNITTNRLALARAKDEHLRDEAAMQQEISRAVQARPELSMIDDPVKLHAAMAADPAIGPMLDQLGAMQKQHADSVTAYTLYGAQLGDPMFQGKQTSELDKSNPGGPPKLIDPNAGTSAQPSGGGAATPNNPLDPPNQIPPSQVNTTADNTPAVAAPLPGSAPGSSAAGMPPTAGLMRPPVTTMVGPLRPGPQLIPAARNSAMNSAPLPGINVPANAATGMFPGIGNPTGAPPSLIPQQGY